MFFHVRGAIVADQLSSKSLSKNAGFEQLQRLRIFLMIHKLGKNKRRSFSAATNLKSFWRKIRSYQVKYAVFLQFKEKNAAFPQLSYKKCRFYAGLKKSAAFLKIRRKGAEKPAFTQSCVLFSQGCNQAKTW